MSAPIMHRDSGIWMKNSLKDLFFEAVIAMTDREDSACAEQMRNGHMQGIYGIGGLGFDIEDFVEYLGSEIGRDRHSLL